MKINFKRTINVLSSFVTIAMILFCTVAMPVLAAEDGIYQLADMVTSTVVEGDEIIVEYDFVKAGVEPFYRFSTGATVLSTGYGSSVGLENMVSDVYTVDFDLLGVRATMGTMPSGLLDISDWQGSAAYSFKCSLYVEAGAYGTVSGGRFASVCYLYFYDQAKAWISHASSEVVNYTMEAQDDIAILNVNIDFVVPENAVYMAVRSKTSIYANYPDDNFCGLDIRLDRSELYSTMSSVIKNSETMEAIKDNIRDLNDAMESVDQSIQEGNNKLDEIINGNDEMNGMAQDMYEEQQELESEMNQMMDDIDSGIDLDLILPDNADQPEDLQDSIDSLLKSNGWSQWKTILSPLFGEVTIGAILLLLVSLINVSVLLLGR